MQKLASNFLEGAGHFRREIATGSGDHGVHLYGDKENWHELLMLSFRQVWAGGTKYI